MTDAEIIEVIHSLHPDLKVGEMEFRVGRAIAAAEREACEKVCEGIESEAYGKHRQKYDSYDEGVAAGALACIEAIRNRGKRKSR